jgi:hypothetical protein
MWKTEKFNKKATNLIEVADENGDNWAKYVGSEIGQYGQHFSSREVKLPCQCVE